MTHKAFCYVDESGQDTKGVLFIVAIVTSGQEKEHLRQVCEEIEQASLKGQRKWTKTAYDRRLAYIRQALERPIFAGKLSFAVYRDTQDYATLTVKAIAAALSTKGAAEHDVTVLIDGLPRSQEQVVGLQLRRHGVNAKKVRGLKDENDALIRLADAMCGLVRDALEEQPAMCALFQRGIQAGVLRNLTEETKMPPWVGGTA
jgi:hypothetical protein